MNFVTEMKKKSIRVKLNDFFSYYLRISQNNKASCKILHGKSNINWQTLIPP